MIFKSVFSPKSPGKQTAAIVAAPHHLSPCSSMMIIFYHDDYAKDNYDDHDNHDDHTNYDDHHHDVDEITWLR